MRAVSVMRCKAYLGGGSQFESTPARAVIGERDAPDLGVVFGRHCHFHVRFDAELPAAELGPVRAEDRRIARVFCVDGLVRRRPSGVAVFITQIEISSVTVAGGIGAPPGDIEARPAAIPRTRICDHYSVSAVPQQMDAWE